MATHKVTIYLALTLIATLLYSNMAVAQEKSSPKLRLSYIKNMDGNCEVKAYGYVKKGKESNPCVGATIGFYRDADYEKLFKKLTADESGKAALELNPQDAVSFKDSTGHYNFYARLEEDKQYESRDADITVMDAAIDVQYKQQGDTVKLLEASLSCYNDSAHKMMPAVKMPLKCFVKRSLCLLPVGEELNYTGEDGNVEVTFPNDIPGDKDGNLTVIVKLDEDDQYGTVQYQKVVKWGVPLVNADNPIAKPSIIGSRNNAPWFMVIIINSILIAIWGYLLYIVYMLFRIKKLSKMPR